MQGQQSRPFQVLQSFHQQANDVLHQTGGQRLDTAVVHVKDLRFPHLLLPHHFVVPRGVEREKGQRAGKGGPQRHLQEPTDAQPQPDFVRVAAHAGDHAQGVEGGEKAADQAGAVRLACGDFVQKSQHFVANSRDKT